MRTIAITKKCTEYEKELILSAVEKADKVLFFDNEKELLESENIEGGKTIYYIPTDANITYTGNNYNKSYTTDKASPVFVIA